MENNPYWNNSSAVTSHHPMEMPATHPYSDTTNQSSEKSVGNNASRTTDLCMGEEDNRIGILIERVMRGDESLLNISTTSLVEIDVESFKDYCIRLQFV